MEHLFHKDKGETETIMNAAEVADFKNKYLKDTENNGAYRLDDGAVAYGGAQVYIGPDDKVFKDLDSLGQYLIEYHGYDTFVLPIVKK
jgi:hypothetical protein